MSNDPEEYFQIEPEAGPMSLDEALAREEVDAAVRSITEHLHPQSSASEHTSYAGHYFDLNLLDDKIGAGANVSEDPPLQSEKYIDFDFDYGSAEDGSVASSSMPQDHILSTSKQADLRDSVIVQNPSGSSSPEKIDKIFWCDLEYLNRRVVQDCPPSTNVPNFYAHEGPPEARLWYSCELCDYETRIKDAFVSHKFFEHNILYYEVIEHPEIQWYHCDICTNQGTDWNTHNLEELLKHKENHSAPKHIDPDKKYYHCYQCFYTTTDLTDYKRHTSKDPCVGLRKEKAEQEAKAFYHCPRCKSLVQSKKKFDIHKRRHSRASQDSVVEISDSDHNYDSERTYDTEHNSDSEA